MLPFNLKILILLGEQRKVKGVSSRAKGESTEIKVTTAT